MKSNSDITSQKLMKQRLDALILAGNRASHCCYNLSQRETLDQRERDVLKETYEAWDAAKKQFQSK